MTGFAFSSCAARKAKRPISADRTLAGILLVILEFVEERGSGSGEDQMTFEAWDNPTARGTRAEIKQLIYCGQSINIDVT
jgi:hypothetical protein